MRDASDNTLTFIFLRLFGSIFFRLTCLPAARKPRALRILSEETFNSLNRSDFECLQSLSTWHDSIRRKMIWCEKSHQSEALVLLRGSAEYSNRSSQTARTTKQRRTSMTRCSEDLSSCFCALRQSAQKNLNLFFLFYFVCLSLAIDGAKRGKSAAGSRVSKVWRQIRHQ